MPMDASARTAVSPLYLLERFEMGIIHLDAERHVVGMNEVARRVLPVDTVRPFDQFVLDFHPERSKPKVGFLLDQAATCPVSNPPPMTMIINIPERVLMIKVSRMSGRDGATTGYTLVFHDITELVAVDEPAAGTSSASSPASPGNPAHQRRRLGKIPTVAGQRIVLVDADDVRCIRSEGHYTHVCTPDGPRFCNLAISDLEDRLDPERFMRVHRSHIVNLQAIEQVKRDAGRLQLRVSGSADPVPVSRSSAAGLLDRLGIPAGSAAGGRQG